VRVREAALGAQDIDEDSISAFVMEAIDRRLEDSVVVHGSMLGDPTGIAH